VHQAERRPPGGDERRKAGIVGQRRDIVHHVGACIQRRTGDRGLAGIDRDRRGQPARAERGDHRRGSGDLRVWIDVGRARPGALAADVEDVGAGFQHRMAGGDRGPRIEVASAIGKAVGRDVENAHHQRGFFRQAGEGRG
jgi:hypothetical protein